MNINFGLTADDYAKHRAGFPDEFFERVFNLGIIKTNDLLVDLGTGTGTLACGFAQRGCNVIGLDISAQMLEQAKDLSEQADLNIDFRFAKAEATGLPDDSFDVVSAGQCWHWFDRPTAVAEVKRILKPNGCVVIAHFDWLPLKDNVVDATEKLIQKYNPSWYETSANGFGLYPQWLRDLGEAGFTDIQTFSFDVDVPYSHDAWRGRIRASAGVGASLSDEDVSRIDLELKSMLEALEQDDAKKESGSYPVLKIPHRVFVAHACKPDL
ncbi:MAG: methyltransferase domain-containing protein [Anaerolineales bacterium]|nr:methyltransferase domain-containing protein [Anaerolineales bacterium]